MLKSTQITKQDLQVRSTRIVTYRGKLFSSAAAWLCFESIFERRIEYQNKEVLSTVQILYQIQLILHRPFYKSVSNDLAASRTHLSYGIHCLPVAFTALELSMEMPPSGNTHPGLYPSPGVPTAIFLSL